MSRNAAPVHGNYHGYYAKRPSIRDPRLEVLPTALFAGKCVLDVGCNEGWVSCEVAQIHAARKVVGVDIDDALIRAAWRKRRTVWSTQGPAPSLPSDGSSSSRKRKREEDAPAVLADYFPASCVHSVGPLPIPDSSPEIFPHNVAFRTADWVNEAIPEDAEGYDVVVAFSITKWIHLNGGDDGLIRFFERAASVLKPGGFLSLNRKRGRLIGKRVGWTRNFGTLQQR
ncbi:unnamed protein product [Mycena citricolor]|uniref:RNA methyltransferase n=1 Tax=Mycena citricolor TaxID=2018698 RepID=A0AAD2H5W2_9AGAR|nr:unnamed protein product [Mycena citricolor]